MKLIKLITLSALLMFQLQVVNAAEPTETYPPQVKVLISQALEAEDGGNFKEAILLHQKILQIQPNNILSINSIAGLYGNLGQYKEETQWAKKALSIDPHYELAYINYGNGMSALGKNSDAKTAYDEALKINPKSASAAYSLGVLADNQKDTTLAIQWYQKAIVMDSQFENAYFNLAVDYANMQKFDEAITALKQLLSINPNDSEAKAMLSDIEKHKAN